MDRIMERWAGVTASLVTPVVLGMVTLVSAGEGCSGTVGRDEECIM
jgi:hypothetical protein